MNANIIVTLISITFDLKVLNCFNYNRYVLRTTFVLAFGISLNILNSLRYFFYATLLLLNLVTRYFMIMSHSDFVTSLFL